MMIGYSEVASTISLITSSYLAYRTHKRDKTQTAKDRREEEKKSKADLTARVHKIGSNLHRLKIANVGQSSAVNVCVTILEGEDIINDSELKEKFPFPQLEPGQSIELSIVFWIGAPNRIQLLFGWSDKGSSQNEKTLYVST